MSIASIILVLTFITLTWLKDAMPVSFDQTCFHLTFQPYLSSESFFSYILEAAKYSYICMLKYY